MVIIDRKLIKKRRKATTGNRRRVIFSHLERPAKMISRQILMQAASFSPRTGRGAVSRGQQWTSHVLYNDSAGVWILERRSNASEMRCHDVGGFPQVTVRLLLAMSLDFDCANFQKHHVRPQR